MDENLIESVKKFPCIWDMSSEFYKCNETKDAAWDQIIIETNILDVKNAKSRWKKLRDNHRDALKRQKGIRSGQARKQRKEWKYQEAMSFLLPYMSNRDRSSNFAPSDDSVSETSNPPNSIDEGLPESSPMPSNTNILPAIYVSYDSTPPIPIQPTSKKRKNDEILDLLQKNQERRELLERERAEIKNVMSPDKFDETDLFFFNLSASTKKLPYYLQLQIKKACFNAVMSAEESNLQQSWHSPNYFGTRSIPTPDSINSSTNTQPWSSTPTPDNIKCENVDV